MPEFAADRQARLLVNNLLRRGQFFGARTARSRRRPAGDLAVASLRILVAVAMNPVDAGLGALMLEAPELLHVALVGRNKAAPAGEVFRLVEHPALFFIADRDFPRSPALGPGVLQRKPVAAIRPFGPDLDRFFAPQSERRL